MSVPDLLNNAKDYVRTLTDRAGDEMNAAIDHVRAVGFAIPGDVSYTLPAEPAKPSELTAPVPSPISLDLPGAPGDAPSYQDISSIDDKAPAAFDEEPPKFTAPNKPAEAAAFNIPVPAVVTDLPFPALPALLDGVTYGAPAVADRVEPVKPQVSVPAFDALAPTDDTVAPQDLEGRFSRAYHDAAPNTIAMVNGYVDAMMTKYNPRFTEQMGRIEDQLATYLNGGTGLKAEVEDAIYARAQERHDVEAQRVRDAAYSEAANRGFTLPSGALLSAVARARQEAANNNLKASTDIAIAQAEMEQKNLQFAVTTSASLRSTILNAALNYMQNLATLNGQALEYAKSVLGMVVENYNLTVKAFGIRLEAYKAEAVVYETRLKSALAGIELYQLEIKALEALTNVDRARIEVYRARIDSLQVYANVYKAQIEAVLGRASLEKMKVDLYQTQVQAYGTLVQAKNAEWGGYVAQINGEKAKQDAFGSQVQAYNAQVQGFSATIQAKAENAKAQAANNEARSRQYASRLAGYVAEVQAKGSKANVELENQRQFVVAFQAKAAAANSFAMAQYEWYKATAQAAAEGSKLRLSAQNLEIESRRAYGQTMAQLGTANANIFANLAGSALAGMNTLASETLATTG